MSIAKEDYCKYYSGSCKPWQVDKYVKELESEKAELVGALGLSIDSKRKRLYIKEINETLKKYMVKP